MQHTEEQRAEFKRQFAKKKRRQINLMILTLAVAPLGLLPKGRVVFGIPSDVAFTVAVVLILSGIVFSFYNWRCPACNKFLGKMFTFKFCEECGVELS